jgi:hypothetical protein
VCRPGAAGPGPCQMCCVLKGRVGVGGGGRVRGAEAAARLSGRPADLNLWPSCTSRSSSCCHRAGLRQACTGWCAASAAVRLWSGSTARADNSGASCLFRLPSCGALTVAAVAWRRADWRSGAAQALLPLGSGSNRQPAHGREARTRGAGQWELEHQVGVGGAATRMHA